MPGYQNFFGVRRNMFNPAAIINSTIISAADGSLVSASGYSTSGMITGITSGSMYTIEGMHSQARNSIQMRFLDSLSTPLRPLNKDGIQSDDFLLLFYGEPDILFRAPSGSIAFQFTMRWISGQDSLTYAQDVRMYRVS